MNSRAVIAHFSTPCAPHRCPCATRVRRPGHLLGHAPCTRAPAFALSFAKVDLAPFSLCASPHAPHCAHRPHHAHARVQVLVRVLRTLREYTSVCFHGTRRWECPHLNTTLRFISPHMWENVSLSHSTSISQHLMFQTLSIDISFT
ncbi:hypothetical protein Hanom_Chr02g00121791 [Helianthus anomalus]